MREQRDRSITFRQDPGSALRRRSLAALRREALRRIQIELPPAERESTGRFELGKASATKKLRLKRRSRSITNRRWPPTVAAETTTSVSWRR